MLSAAMGLLTPLNTPWSSVRRDLSEALIPYLEAQGLDVLRGLERSSGGSVWQVQ